MQKRLCGVLLVLTLCASLGACESGPKKFSATYWDVFDTVTTITCYARSQAEFDAAMEAAHAELIRLHNIFDLYHEHPGVNGVYALNHSGGAPIRIEKELEYLIQLSQDLGAKAPGAAKVNPAMGAVLDIWHRYREQGTEVPSMEALQEAARHVDPKTIRRDENGDTYLADPLVRLDMGAIAKGYATDCVAAVLRAHGITSFLIDAGGNVLAGDAPGDGRAYWTVGVTDPQNPGEILIKLRIVNLSVVTSGGYQRYYEVDGVRYHHIIDPDTLMPSGKYLQTTIIRESSCLADYDSTDWFIRTYEDYQSAEDAGDRQVIWVNLDGTIQMTDGAEALVL